MPEEAKTVKQIIEAALVGKRVRFPDLTQQFEREEVHTVEAIHFDGRHYDEGDADNGVSVVFTTSKAPGLGGATSAWVYYDLAGRVEFVND